MATKLEKMAEKLNEDFREKIIETMREKFGIEVENNFSIFDMKLYTTRVDGEDFTPEQDAYLEAYSNGFGQAMSIVMKEVTG
jgi:hypothetical protein